MEIEEVENLIENDKDFKEGIDQVNINLNNDDINEIPPTIYNPVQFQTEILINYFQNKNIFKKIVVCPKCGQQCKMVKDNQKLDKFVWRCRSRNPNHDTKLNLRINSVFEESRYSIQIIYFLLFYCFTEKKSINSTLTECESFSKQVGVVGINKQSIINFFAYIRKILKNKMHSNWSKSLLGEDGILDKNGYISCEIDESEIIGNSNVIYWMFGIVERSTKEARIFCVLNNRTKENLLPLVKNNIITAENEDNDDEDLSENESVKTRIYSDCFSSYQVNDFKEMGYILKRVNHSVWFGYGIFHTNNIESLWGQIKRYCNNFSGISIESLNNKFNNNEDMIKDYLDGWICYSLFLRNIIRKKLSWNDRINYLCKFLECNI